MKITFVGSHILDIELTRRNLETLLAKLDDPLSARMLQMRTEDGIVVCVSAVENEDHYRDREPGPVYMPSSGKML